VSAAPQVQSKSFWINSEDYLYAEGKPNNECTLYNCFSTALD